MCSNGTTGVLPTVLDCAGACNTSEVDDCGVCQVKGFSTEKDCNDDCLGSAITGDCGICVLGRTNKTADHGKILICEYLQ